MPSTYALISSNVLSSSAASVTFSSIPATFTDLVLRLSARGDNAAVVASGLVKLNAMAGTNYSQTRLKGDGAGTASSSRDSLDSNWYLYQYPAANALSNTFGSVEMYIPNYTGTQQKIASSFVAGENNTTSSNGAVLTISAHLLNLTSTVNEISITNNGGNFVSNSSFFLYGIKNS